MKRLVTLIQRTVAAVRARRTAFMALGALAFGAMAVLGARNYIGERLALEKARLQPRHEMVELVVAKRDLKRGDTVGPETMAVRSLPREYAPGGAIVPTRFESVAGARLLAPMKAGEPLLPGGFATAETSGISSRVRPGVRAMTIAVDEVNSMSGMLQPGDRIDLLLSVRPPSMSGVVQPEVTRTVMQSVPVMATGRQSRASFGDEPGAGRTYTSITVEVEPEQAQKLVVAQRSGKLTAVLRNPEDRKTVGDKRLDVNTLLGLPTPQLAAAGRVGAEVIVGGKGSLPPGAGGAAAAAGPGGDVSASGAVGPGRAAALGAPPVPVGAASPPLPSAGLPQVPNFEGGRPIGTLPEGAMVPPLDTLRGPFEPPATVPLYR